MPAAVALHTQEAVLQQTALQIRLAQLWALALVIYAFQVLFASLWLRYFRQGPVEWVWRCLTAGKYSPNLR